MRRRMILMLVGSVIAVATITTTVIITTMDKRSSRAKDVVVRPIHLITDQTPVNEFSIPQPVLDASMPAPDQAIFIRKLKATDNISNSQR
ncbi:MAG: hypothetical protein ACKOA1_09755 [Bacteroidota bacterium]